MQVNLAAAAWEAFGARGCRAPPRAEAVTTITLCCVTWALNPNPFNPETTIRFALPEASHGVIEVFDVLGREVVRLVDGEAAGHHSVVFEAGRLASGIYVYRMVSDRFEQHRTVLLMK